MGSIDPRAKQALISRIKSVLDDCSLEATGLLNMPQEKHGDLYKILDALPDSKKEELKAYLGEFGEFIFIFDFIRSDPDLPEVEKTTLLSSITSTDDLAKKIAAELLALPYNYTALLPLPIQGITLGESPIEIGPHIKICQYSKTKDSGFSFPDYIHDPRGGTGLPGALAGIRKYSIEPGRIYIQINGIGFIGSYISSPTIDQMIESYRGFLGCCLALGIFEIQSTTSRTNEHLLVSFHNAGADKQYIRHIVFNDRENELAHSISIRSTLLQPQTPDAEGENHKTPVVSVLPASVMSRVSNLFGRSNDEEDAKQIINAAVWLYEGEAMGEGVFSFILTTTGLEALLGEKTPSENITNLLASRCAFLIGKGASHREKIIKTFKKFYNTRSNILHRGSRSLTPEELFQLYKLKELLRVCLWHEIKNTAK